MTGDATAGAGQSASTGTRTVRTGTVWFVSRHPGAVEWAARKGIAVDRWIAHLNLSLDLPEAARGRELTADEMERFDARFEPFVVEHGSCASDCGQLTYAVANERVRE